MTLALVLLLLVLLSVGRAGPVGLTGDPDEEY